MLAIWITASAAAATPIQVASTVLLRDFSAAPVVEFDEQPAITVPRDQTVVRKLGDGFSIVVCRRVTAARRFTDCSNGKWTGQNTQIDAIALRAMKNAKMADAQYTSLRGKMDQVMTTIRFSASREPPTGACPPIWCRVTVPPPPPPPKG